MSLSECKYIKTFFLCLLVAGTISSQVPDNWFNLDPELDQINGVSTERSVEELLQGRPVQPVIVAVIDGGVDHNHEDLKSVMWQNADEIPDNGIDDDKNGYVDDVYGWNFIGGPDGKNVDHDTYEITRIVSMLRKKYADVDASNLNGQAKEEYQYYLTLKEDVDEQYQKAKAAVEQSEQILSYIKFALQEAKKALGDGPIEPDEVEDLDEQKYGMVKGFFAQLLPQLGQFDGSVEDLEVLLMKDIEGGTEQDRKKMDYGYNTDFDPRHIVKDNYADLSQKYYGNPDVKGPDGFHGTHVAGIIAADRTNEIGIKGVSSNARIMAIRAVPDGDERDKDVANAIIYAVDNGAKVINMSFGKGYSPQESAVEKAIKYAERNDVLLVHAAGNENQNTDLEERFPNSSYDHKRGLFGKKRAANWLEVGALSWEQGSRLVASFSNYGQTSVDLFAPGQNIMSTAPGSEYKDASGTSMAAPVVSGVAATLRGYFPSLSAKEVKAILTQSARPYLGEVVQPGTGETVPFKMLSRSGGVVNLKSAVIRALQVLGEPVKPMVTDPKKKNRA